MRPRPPAVAVLGMAGMLTLAAAVFGVATSTASVSGSSAFTARVLSEATVPPGGQPTGGIHTLELSWLGGWGPTPGVRGLADAHAFYLYDEPAIAVATYIEKHPPRGVRTSGTGTGNGVIKSVTEKVPVFGPDEYDAWLTYTVAPTNGTLTKSELRIDAKTVWVPPRPRAERVPRSGVLQVTGFRTATVRTPDQGPVTVVVPPERARKLRRDVNDLRRGASTMCMETQDLWSVTVRPALHSPPSFTADGVACEATVLVTINGKAMPVLSDRGCVVLRDIAALVPRRARSTLSAARRCTGRWT